MVYSVFRLKHLIIICFKVSHKTGSDYDEKEFKNLTRLTLVKLKSNCNSVSHKTHCRDYVPHPPHPAMVFTEMHRYQILNSNESKFKNLVKYTLCL